MSRIVAVATSGAAAGATVGLVTVVTTGSAPLRLIAASVLTLAVLVALVYALVTARRAAPSSVTTRPASARQPEKSRS